MITPVYRAVSSLDVVGDVRQENDHMILEISDPDRHCADVVNAIVQAGGRITSVGELRHSLEDVYIKLIGERNEV
jgi:ABC-2 type transport system ATP-binding protein